MKYLTRTTLAGLVAGAGLMFTVFPSSSASPAIILEASPASSSPSSPIVIEETPRLAEAAQAVDVAPVAAEAATPAQEAPTAPAADPPARIADAVLVTRTEAAPAPAPVVTAPVAAPAPASSSSSSSPAIVDDPAVWVRLPGGYCSEVGRSDVVAGMTVDPTCPAGQPAPPTNPAPGPSVTVYDPLTGSCITMSAADAARLGAHAALPGFCDR